MRNLKKAILVLEDGTAYKGLSFGSEGETTGEVVFNTSMTGYQEILTDPSYAGQIVSMTYPLIGNYGVNKEDFESRKPFLKGFVVKEASNIYSNWRADGSLADLLKENNIVGIQDIDTRALTRRIRDKGAMRAVISTESSDILELTKKAEASEALEGLDLVKTVTIDEGYSRNAEGKGYNIVALDFGMKRNILKQLLGNGFNVTVLPASAGADEILNRKPDGVFLSNGPGDPKAVTYAIRTIEDMLGKVPIFGICLGHQLLSRALGADTYKLKFGHHGANHPVKNLRTGKVEITAQNHGFAILPETIPDGVEVTHLNLNDETIEGLRSDSLSAFSVQYHPEASPGPHDSEYLFNEFKETIKRFGGSNV